MSRKTELVEMILQLRDKKYDIKEARHLYSLSNAQLEKIYNYECKKKGIEDYVIKCKN